MSTEWDIDVTDLTAEDVKGKAEEERIDLCGIADADAIAENPPPGDNETVPDDIVHGAASVIVVADRTTHGTSSIAETGRTPGNRTKDVANEVAMEDLEEKTLELVYFLEEHGHPSLMVTPELTRTRQYDLMDEGPLSLPHAAVEAGLGTLGLNLQLLTPEYGPRVILGAVVTTADLEPDDRREEALCHGAKCGRCLLASPGDAVEYFDLDAERARQHTEPWGYHKLLETAGKAIDADSQEELEDVLLKNRDTMMLWQSMLRGAGVYTGSTRSEDACPVGEDFERIREAQAEIPEATEEKWNRLIDLRERERDGDLPESSETYRAHRRWIGDLDPDYDDVPEDLDYEFLDVADD